MQLCIIIYVGLVDVFNQKVICIDNSTNSCAYAIGEGSRLIEYGEIKFPGKDTYSRLVNIRDCLSELREKCKDINSLYIEQTTFIQSKQTVILLGVAEGATISSIAHPGMAIGRPQPIVWQRAIGNPPLSKLELAELRSNNPGKNTAWIKAESRRIRKQRTLDIVNKRFNINLDNDNLGDAVGLFAYIVDKK